MKKLIKYPILALAAITMAFVSCCDEPDTPMPPNVKTVFPNGVPTSVNGAKITTNNKGLVTKIAYFNEDITIEYGTFSRDMNFNVKATVKSLYGKEVFFMQTNKQGFATYALHIDSYYPDEENDDETNWFKFEYNSDGQLTRVQCSETGDDYTITYTDGDITKVVNHWEELIISYTDGKPNKGCVMDFNEFFGIDLGNYMGILYYAGLIGKASNNLPTGIDICYGSNFYRSYSYLWKFNSDNLPTEFRVKEGPTYLTWSWK